MAYLLTAIGVNLCMTFLMRYSEHHDGNRYALNIWNYITGTLISFFMLEDKTLVLHSDLLSVISGILNGIGFVAALIFIQLSIRRNGAPLTTTFNRLGILIPTILSALLFLEIPAPVHLPCRSGGKRPVISPGWRPHAPPGYTDWHRSGNPPFPLVKDIVGYLKMCHSILPIKR